MRGAVGEAGLLKLAGQKHPATARAAKPDGARTVSVGVENEETDFARSQARLHTRDNVLIEGRTVQKRHRVRQTGAGDMLCQVLENIPGGELVILERAAWLNADKPFFAPGSAHPKACRDRRRAEERADLENAAVANFRHVIDENEHIFR